MTGACNDPHRYWSVRAAVPSRSGYEQERFGFHGVTRGGWTLRRLKLVFRAWLTYSIILP